MKLNGYCSVCGTLIIDGECQCDLQRKVELVCARAQAVLNEIAEISAEQIDTRRCFDESHIDGKP